MNAQLLLQRKQKLPPNAENKPHTRPSMADVPSDAAPEATAEAPSSSHAPAAFEGLILVAGFGAVFLGAFVACLWNRLKEKQAVRRASWDTLSPRHQPSPVPLVPFHGVSTHVPPALNRLGEIQHRDFATVSVTTLPRYEEPPSAGDLTCATAPAMQGDIPPPYSPRPSDAAQVDDPAVPLFMDNSFIRPNNGSTIPLSDAAPPRSDGLNQRKQILPIRD